MKTQTGNDQPKVLFVDDQQLTRVSVARLLKNMFLDAVTAGSGSAALAHINNSAYDLYIFDIGLPDINGLELTKLVKEISQDNHVIIMTGGDVDDSMQKEIDSSSACLINKPFEIEFFSDCVLGFLGKLKKKGERKLTQDCPAAIRADRTARLPLSKKIAFTYNQLCAGYEREGAKKIVRQSFSGKTLNISDKGLGFQTDFPLKENSVLSFNDEIEFGKWGVVKWSAQSSSELYNCGMKFI